NCEASQESLRECGGILTSAKCCFKIETSTFRFDGQQALQMNYSDPDTVPTTWEVGDVILDLYEVKQIYTGGGMGLVYRVYHREWDMDLAVKCPRPEFFRTEEQIANFEREAKTWVS